MAGGWTFDTITFSIKEVLFDKHTNTHFQGQKTRYNIRSFEVPYLLGNSIGVGWILDGESWSLILLPHQLDLPIGDVYTRRRLLKGAGLLRWGSRLYR